MVWTRDIAPSQADPQTPLFAPGTALVSIPLAGGPRAGNNPRRSQLKTKERAMKTVLFLTAHQQKLAFLTLLSFLSLC